MRLSAFDCNMAETLFWSRLFVLRLLSYIANQVQSLEVLVDGFSDLPASQSAEEHRHLSRGPGECMFVPRCGGSLGSSK